MRTVYAGDRTSFFCRAVAGIPTPTVFWRTSSGYRVPNNYLKEVRGGVALKFRKLYRGHQGKYVCVGLNIAGKQEKSVTLNVKGTNFVFVFK